MSLFWMKMTLTGSLPGRKKRHWPRRCAQAMLLAVPLVLLMLLPAQQGQAQTTGTQNKPPTLESLQRRVTLLESELAALREQLQELVGTELRYQVQEVQLGSSPVRGGQHAPITLVLFGDYQSDYTARAHQVVLRLLAAFPDDLRYIFKHYPLTEQHPFANDAALAAVAAEEQGLFWEFHDKLLENTRRLDLTITLLLAEEVGLDLPAFDAARRSIMALSRLAADEKEATRLNVSGVPALFLNGRLLSTWRHDYLHDQIEQLRGTLAATPDKPPAR